MKYLMLLLILSNGVYGMETVPENSTIQTPVLPIPSQLPLDTIIDTNGNQYVYNPRLGVYVQIVRMPQTDQECARCAAINFSSENDDVVNGIVMIAHDLKQFKNMRDRLDHIIQVQYLIHKEYKSGKITNHRKHVWRSYASLYNLYTIVTQLNKKEKKTIDEEAYTKALHFLLNRLNDHQEEAFQIPPLAKQEAHDQKKKKKEKIGSNSKDLKKSAGS